MPPPGILTLNAGSSSIKFAIFEASDGLPLLWAGSIDGIGRRPALVVRSSDGVSPPAPPLPVDLQRHADLLSFLLEQVVAPAAPSVGGVGHRVVHGGRSFRTPVEVTPPTMADLEKLVPLARSHQPHNLAGIRAAQKVWPGARHIACFDTAFHHTIPEPEALFALPQDLIAEGVRRYGFHGLSYQSIARQLHSLLGDRATEPTVVAHLGNGASLCGMVGLESRTTSMGFTPLDGLVMGRRPGRLDPGVVLHLMTEKGMSADALSEFLNTGCGLYGLSGGRSDMRDLLASADPLATLAVDVFVGRLVAEIGAAAATIGGLSTLVFTGGIGENAAKIRRRTVERLAWLGARLDDERNRAGEVDFGVPGSFVRLLVLKTDEEREIAQAVASGT